MVEEGYVLPAPEVVRFFASGNNLFYFSKFKLWDPELDTADGLKYPSMRSVMLGFEVKF